jgi:hypothetical protein
VDNVNGKDPFCGATALRIRRSEALIERIRRDHLELNRLWERFRKGTIDVPGIDEAFGLTASIREALCALEELRREDIEGVLWTGVDDIRRDISDKETTLINCIFLIKERGL